MAQIKVNLKPFHVPEGVYAEGKPGLKQDGTIPLSFYPLRDLDLQTLEELCAEFRANVLIKAGHEDILNK